MTMEAVNHINHGSQAGRREEPVRDPAGIKLWDCFCGAITMYQDGKFVTWREPSSPEPSEAEIAKEVDRIIADAQIPSYQDVNKRHKLIMRLADLLRAEAAYKRGGGK